MSYLYHYTTKEGFQAIIRDGCIKMSPNALYGQGVYLTSIDPSTPTFHIILNNWDDGIVTLRSPHALARTEYAIRIPMSSIPEVVKVADQGGRDIWIYRSHMYLQGRNVTVYARH